MKYALLASVAILFVGTSATFAVVPALELKDALVKPTTLDLLQLASDDGDDNGGGSDDNGGGSDDNGGGSDDDGDDDHDGGQGSDDGVGGDHHDGMEHSSKDLAKAKGSKSRRARVPGGSGCDSARDKVEHPECNAN